MSQQRRQNKGVLYALLAVLALLVLCFCVLLLLGAYLLASGRISLGEPTATAPPPSTPVAVTTALPVTPASTEITPAPESAETPEAGLGIELANVYSDPNEFFTLRYPAGWLERKSRVEMQFRPDKDSSALLAVSLQIKFLSAKNLVDDMSSFLAGKWGDYREEGREAITISGYEAVLVRQVYQLDGAAYRGFILGLVRNRVGYLILAQAPADQYLQLEPTFRAIAASLQVREWPEAPAYDQWLQRESEHFIFHYLPNTYVAEDIKRIARDHEDVFADIAGRLSLEYEGPIHIYFYPSKQALYRSTARDSGFAINEASEVHTLWVSADEHQSLGHEMTHVITYWEWGEPSEALLGEGIAVCLDHARPAPHRRAAALLEEGRLVPLSDALGEAWFEQDPAVMYPQSGSFVCYLLEEYGWASVKEVYNRDDFEVALEEVLGLSLKQIETGWLDTLTKR